MCTCICVYRCIYYVCERVFIKLFYLKFFFKGKKCLWNLRVNGSMVGCRAVGRGDTALARAEIQWFMMIYASVGSSQDETLAIFQIQQGMGKNRLQVMSWTKLQKEATASARGEDDCWTQLDTTVTLPLWEGLIVKMLEGGVHNSFEHEFLCKQFAWPAQSWTLCRSKLSGCHNLIRFGGYKHV